MQFLFLNNTQNVSVFHFVDVESVIAFALIYYTKFDDGTEESEIF